MWEKQINPTFNAILKNILLAFLCVPSSCKMKILGLACYLSQNIAV